MFHVGQKVVLVGAPKLSKEWHVGEPAGLKLGNIYTIREIDLVYVSHFGMAGIRIFEHIAPVVNWNNIVFEPCFLSHSFRPLVE